MYNLNMKKKIQNDLTVHSLNTLHLSFNDFDGMEQYGKNWSFYCKYRFGTGGFSGRYDIYQNENFQLATSYFNDGLMYNGHPPKDTISVLVIMQRKGTLCANQKSIYVGEVYIFDDIDEYEVVFSEAITAGIISIKKSFVDLHFPFLYEMTDRIYKDSDMLLSKMLDKVQTEFSSEKKDIEELFINSLNGSISNQQEIQRKLTSGEKLAFEARNYILQELESCINVSSLALKYDISEKTLQKSFKSLFGFTPKQFIRILKLNLAHRDITQGAKTVSEVATKWGFNHLGRFSKEYKKLFGVFPNESLKYYEKENSHIDNACLVK